jgi:hypothetical protein
MATAYAERATRREDIRELLVEKKAAQFAKELWANLREKFTQAIQARILNTREEFFATFSA